MLKEINIGVSKAMSICLKHGIKVSPVIDVEGGVKKFKVAVDDNGSVTVFNKIVSGKEINISISKTYKHYAKIILNKIKEDANRTNNKEKTLDKGA